MPRTKAKTTDDDIMTAMSQMIETPIKSAVANDADNFKKSPILILLPNVIWVASLTKNDTVKISSSTYRTVFGISQSTQHSNYYWPELLEENKLNGFAIFDQNNWKWSASKDWNGYYATGALIYNIRQHRKDDTFLNVLMPGCREKIKNIISEINQVTYTHDPQKFYPRKQHTPENINDDIDCIIAKLAVFNIPKSKPIAFLNTNYVASIDSNNSLMIRSNQHDFLSFFPWIKYQLIGSKTTFELKEKLNLDEEKKLLNAAKKSDADIKINNLNITITPKNNEENWLLNVANNFFFGEKNA